MTSKIVVGLLDSGVSVSQMPWVIDQCNFPAKEYTSDTDGDVDCIDQIGHGAALTEVILSHESSLCLLVARIFQERLTTTPVQVAAGLDWLVEQGAQVINMSFGLHADREVLREACRRALAKGVVLVGASPARGTPVFPSAYTGVLRATGDARCSFDELSLLRTAQADYGACVRSKDTAIAGASAGAAHLTGHIAQFLRQNAREAGPQGIGAVKCWLSTRADYFGPERRLG